MVRYDTLIPLSTTTTNRIHTGRDFLTTAPHPDVRPVPGLPAGDIARHRARTRTREEEHAALCVLDDWELTMTHALNSRRVCWSFEAYEGRGESY
jgi:hypothetical protein